jgi:hypothetical protein
LFTDFPLASGREVCYTKTNYLTEYLQIGREFRFRGSGLWGIQNVGGRRSFATACIFGALTVLCAPAAFSQTLTTGDIAGPVKKDAGGAAVPSAIVTIEYTVKTIGRSRGGLLYTF